MKLLVKARVHRLCNILQQKAVYFISLGCFGEEEYLNGFKSETLIVNSSHECFIIVRSFFRALCRY